MTEPEHTGGCMCGAVRFRTTHAPSRTIHCHCADCRKHSGAPMATLSVFLSDQVLFDGTPRKIYTSSDIARRGFCQDCGTTLTFETDLRSFGPVVAIHVSAFDDPEALPPTHHSFYSEKLSWFEVLDDLPRHERLVVDGGFLGNGPSSGTPKAD